jgi:tRNA G26 N,N-dimethylase Trm1
MAMTATRKQQRQKERERALSERCADCPHCRYDHKFYGPGWVYLGNNGPISPCPLCNPEGKHPRQR